MLKTSLRYFLAVVRSGSIRAASAELHVAQSAVSRQLQQLEHEVGQPLLERRARGVTLTPAGQLLFSYGKAAQFEVERLESELDELQHVRRGHVRVASMETCVPFLLPEVVDRFRSLYPGVSFSIDVDTSQGVVNRILSGEGDVGIAFMPDGDAEIRTAFRLTAPLYAVLAASHPLAARERLAIRDLAGWSVGLAPRYSGGRILFDQACRSDGVTIAPALESNSVDLLHRFALKGTGIAVLHRHTCGETVRQGTLKAIAFKEDIMNAGYIEVFSLASRRLPVAAERLLGVLEEEMTTGSR